MRHLLLLFTLFTSTLYGQQTFQSVDSIVLNKKYKSINVKDLSIEIASDFQTDFNKIRAFYMYVVTSIKYDIVLSKRVWYPRSNEEMDSIVLSEVNRTIQTKKGICWDFSALFEKLCFYSSIEAEQIGGTLRNKEVISENFIANHGWNSVKLNGERKFIDCTFVPPEKYNKAEYDKYFLVNPEEFIYRCFPIEKSKQYLNRPIDYENFKKLVYTSNSFFAHQIKSIKPNLFNTKVRIDNIYPISFTVNNIADLKSFEVYLNDDLQGIISINNSKVNYKLTKVLKLGDILEIKAITEDAKKNTEYVSPCITYKISSN
jgi:transglutaminase/protease-like cytokinesis protein 3